MNAQNTSLSSLLQQELLKLLGREVAEEDLVAIKDLIGKYFLNKLQNKVDFAVKEKGYSQQEFDAWLMMPGNKFTI